MRFAAALLLLPLLGMLTACGPTGTLSDIQEGVEYLQAKRNTISDTSKVESLLRHLEKTEELSAQLDGLQPTLQNDKQRKTYQALRRELDALQRQWQAYREDPSLYNIGGHLKRILVQREHPLTQRIDTLRQILQYTPDYYRSARTKLDRPAPPKLELAMRKQRAGLRFLNKELPDSLEKVPLDGAEAAVLAAAMNEARLALKDYLAWCNSLLIERIPEAEIQK